MKPYTPDDAAKVAPLDEQDARLRGAVAKALREAAFELWEQPWEEGEANRGPSSPKCAIEWVRGASDGVEWTCERLHERADRIERGES